MDISVGLFDFLSNTYFMPHGYCYRWITGLVALHVISDATIALSYMIIPFGLAYFVYSRKDLSFGWMFFCFSAFIFACGTTHIMEIWTLWYGDYWISGFIKAITGIVSFITAILLIKLIPTAITLPGPETLRQANIALGKEIENRKQKEFALEKTNTQLQVALDVISKNKIQLEEKNRLLESVGRLKNEFLANMSHELRTPLNGIIGFAEIMYDEVNKEAYPEHKEYLKDILSSSHHLLQLINDILDLSKIESGRMKFYPEPINFKIIIDEVTDTLKPLIAMNKINLTAQIEPQLARVQLDPQKFKQLLYNLLSNAIKFTPENGNVDIRICSENEDYFRVEVKDNGIGIREDDINKLFIEFQQLDPTIAKKYPGTGLGLALSRRIVEAQGGYIGVTSVFGKGSTFYAVLPYEYLESNHLMDIL